MWTRAVSGPRKRSCGLIPALNSVILASQDKKIRDDWALLQSARNAWRAVSPDLMFCLYCEGLPVKVISDSMMECRISGLSESHPANEQQSAFRLNQLSIGPMLPPAIP